MPFSPSRVSNKIAVWFFCKGINSLPQTVFLKIPLPLEPNDVDLRYFKLGFFLNSKGLHHPVAKM